MYLGLKKLMTTTVFPQTKGHVARDNKTLVTQLRVYIVDNQRNRDTFVQPLIYAYNYQIHHSTKTTSSLTSSRYPPESITVFSQSIQRDEAESATSPKYLRQEIMHQVPAMQEKASNILTTQQAKY